MIDLLLQLSSVEGYLAGGAGGLRPLTAGETLILLAMAEEAEAYIKNRWPVATGQSRDAWRVSVEGLALRFENGTDYAEYVHWQGEGPNALWDALYEEVLEEVIDPGIADLIAAIQATNLARRPAQSSLPRPLQQRLSILIAGGA